MLASLGRPGEVGPVLEALTRRHPGTSTSWLALVRHRAGREPRDDQALAAPVEAARKSVQGRTPELIEARCWQAAGDRVRAESAFGTARARRPGDRDVLVEAAAFYRDNDIPTLAESCLRDAAAVAPGNRAVARDLAMAITSRSQSAEDWTRAWSLIAAEIPGPDEAEGPPLPRRPPGQVPRPRQSTRRSCPRLESLLANLPSTSPVAGRSPRAILARFLVATGQGERRPSRQAKAAAGPLERPGGRRRLRRCADPGQAVRGGRPSDRPAAGGTTRAGGPAWPPGPRPGPPGRGRRRPGGPVPGPASTPPPATSIGREALTVLAAGGPASSRPPPARPGPVGEVAGPGVDPGAVRRQPRRRGRGPGPVPRRHRVRHAGGPTPGRPGPDPAGVRRPRPEEARRRGTRQADRRGSGGRGRRASPGAGPANPPRHAPAHPGPLRRRGRHLSGRLQEGARQPRGPEQPGLGPLRGARPALRGDRPDRRRDPGRRPRRVAARHPGHDPAPAWPARRGNPRPGGGRPPGPTACTSSTSPAPT